MGEAPERRLISWLKENGAEIPNLVVKKYENSNERGVFTSTAISKAEVILRIPHKCLLTCKLSYSSLEACRIFWASRASQKDEALEFNCSEKLIAVVLYILLTIDDPTNFFAPYYKTLPRTFNHFTLFWNKNEVERLQGSPIVSDIKQRRESFAADFNILNGHEVLAEEFRRKKITMEKFFEIRCLVGSRNFNLNINGEKNTCMVPFADLLNHSRPAETKWTYNNVDHHYQMKSLRAIGENREVFDSYGAKSNLEYLLFYGFVVENNVEKTGLCRDTVHLTESIILDAEKFSIKRKNLLHRLKIFVNEKNQIVESFDITKNVTSVQNLLSFFALKHAANSEDDVFFLETLNEVKQEVPVGVNSFKKILTDFLN
eukprot:augustus_masked-scaffold_39-processed-gene-0.28-mRNA-1 protein AED:0.34 eAED:0.34 QI:0/-1/0/1/-1/1/1/0/372